MTKFKFTEIAMNCRLKVESIQYGAVVTTRARLSQARLYSNKIQSSAEFA